LQEPPFIARSVPFVFLLSVPPMETGGHGSMLANEAVVGRPRKLKEKLKTQNRGWLYESVNDGGSRL